MWGTADCGHTGPEACACAGRAGPAQQGLDELEFVRSACHYAATGALERLERVLAARPDALHGDGAGGGSGYTPLHYAARAGQLKAVQLLLRHGAAVDAATRAGGATPLQRAAHTGHLEVAEALLAAGADPLLADADGETPLHKAAAQGHADVAAALLRAGPSAAGSHDKRGRTPRERATGAAARAPWW
ncbi:ANKRD39 [Scenedesmus sp. PABB004]|nr:ANKRD39 [Scenedesmus sp. PABB004]